MGRPRRIPDELLKDSAVPLADATPLPKDLSNESPIQRQIAAKRGWMKPRQDRKALNQFKMGGSRG